MKKILFFILSLCLIFSLAACNTSDTSSQEILDKKAIIMGMDKNYLPMGFVDENGIYTGFDIDLAKEISKKMITSSGVSATLNIVPVSMDEAINGLNDGSVDFLGNSLSVSDLKTDSVIFSNPVFKNNQVIVVKSDSSINVKDDLINKKIGVVTGSLSEKALMDNDFLKTKTTLVAINDRKEIFDKLTSGEIDAVAIDEVAAKYFISKGMVLRVLDETLREDEYCLVFDAKSKALKNKVDDIIKELKKDGTLEALSIEWFGENIIN